METINRENEFGSIQYEAGNLRCVTKPWLINFGYYWQLAHRPVAITVPLQEIKKLAIQSTKPVIALFISLAALAIFAGIIYKSMDGNDGALTTGIIIALVFLFLGFLYLKSKTRQLKVLAATYKGGNIVLYVSTNREELKALRKMIEDKRNTGKV